MRVLIAPDSFGDTLTAVEAAAAIATGWHRARPGDTLVRAPRSDGGPGFVDVLAVQGGDVRTVTVSGPLGDPVTARWLHRGDTAHIESAQACGLHLLRPGPAVALAAHSAGVGELVADALAAGVRTIVVGLGGSGCTDGGRGLVTALGGSADAAGLATARARLAGIDLVAATDVENPLIGPTGAAAVFGPQKGADAAALAELERRNTEWAQVVDDVAGRPVSTAAGAGAAGGIGAALLALGGHRRAGADVVAESTDQDALLRDTDIVVTGEGRFDEQSLGGKVAVALARAARNRAVPVIVLAGQVTLGDDHPGLAELGLLDVRSVADHAGSVERAMTDAAVRLAALAEDVARSGVVRPD